MSSPEQIALGEPLAASAITRMQPDEFLTFAEELRRRQAELDDHPEGDRSDQETARHLLAGIGILALRQVELAGNTGRAVDIITIAQAMDARGLEGLVEAEVIVDQLRIAKDQFARDRPAPFLILREENGGLAITAGTSTGEINWDADTRLPPELHMNTTGGQQIAFRSSVRFVTDTQKPERLITDFIEGKHDPGVPIEEYESFLAARFRPSGDENPLTFPEDMTLVGLGEEGIDYLLQRFNALLQPHFDTFPLGEILAKRIQDKIRQAAQEAARQSSPVIIEPDRSLYRDYEEVLSRELLAMAERDGVNVKNGSPYYETIAHYLSRKMTLDAVQIARWITPSVYRRQNTPFHASITLEELETVIAAEIDMELNDIQRNGL